MFQKLESEAQEMFGSMRDATITEQVIVYESIEKEFIEINMNFFELSRG